MNLLYEYFDNKVNFDSTIALNQRKDRPEVSAWRFKDGSHTTIAHWGNVRAN